MQMHLRCMYRMELINLRNLIFCENFKSKHMHNNFTPEKLFHLNIYETSKIFNVSHVQKDDCRCYSSRAI